MSSDFAYSIFGAEDVAEVPYSDGVSEKLLDDRHLSKSALRAFELLEFFTVHQQPARATEIAQALELSPSSADQLLKSLASRAYLIFDSRRKLYRPSPRLLGFSAFLGQSYYGGNRLQALMQELAENTECSVSISTPVGQLMQLVHFIAPQGNSDAREPGELFPLFNSAAGGAILATWPVDTVLSYIEQSREKLGELAETPDVILEYLDGVRADGHAFGGGTAQADECAVALALPRSGLGADLTISLRGEIDYMKAWRWRLAALADEAIAKHLKPDR